jgi:ferredoxin
MRCGICVEVCNFEAIAMNNTWTGQEQSRFDRSELVLDLDQLLAQSKARKIACSPRGDGGHLLPDGRAAVGGGLGVVLRNVACSAS